MTAMRKVLVIGASGLLGQHMMDVGDRSGLQMVGTYNDQTPSGGPRMVHMNITDPASVSSVLAEERPDMTVLCAAMTNVDLCEREPNEAYAVNMEGAFNVAAGCKEAGSRLTYVSTDFVFNGLKGGRYHEFDVPDPTSVYAKSKLEGERVTMDSANLNLVCRVSVVYGWNRTGKKNNFVTWVIGSLRKGERIRLYHDQFVSPTYAPAAAQVILDLGSKGAKGVYHTSGPDCISRYDMGVKVAEVFGLDPDLISPVATKDMPLLAPRPPRSCLAVDMVEAELDRPMVGLEQGLEMMRAEE